MANNIVVVDDPEDWPEFPGGEVVAARSFLTDPRFANIRRARVFNLCKSYTYQSMGYYVSLLAAARGCRPMPGVAAIQEMKSLSIIRFVSDELDELIQKSLHHITGEKFTLSIYFGKNVAKAHNSLSGHLFKQFQAPLIRAKFTKGSTKWVLQSIKPIPTSEIPDEHWPSVLLFAAEYLEKGASQPTPRRSHSRFDLAILHHPGEPNAPSNPKAMKRFVKAAEELGFSVELITKDDYGRLAEFDALFIRETTNVHHHTYRFAQRAAAEGLVVIDDPDSILLCTNKVFLAELLAKNKIDHPKTLIVHKGNVGDVASTIGFPCILKQPDSSFSQGVYKVNDQPELDKALEELLEDSDLIIAQEFLPTEFDWRVGIMDGKPLYVCKYFMAKKAWKIQVTDQEGETDYGEVETLPVGLAPKKVVSTALEAAELIGNGLYGVDLKQIGKRVLVIEVNDNPSIDCGFEDRILKDELYSRIMEVLLKRVEDRSARRKETE
jgi:glutathione synthase/RimK-type ligase-like ATP-grasp enzyme